MNSILMLVSLSRSEREGLIRTAKDVARITRGTVTIEQAIDWMCQARITQVTAKW